MQYKQEIVDESLKLTALANKINDRINEVEKHLKEQRYPVESWVKLQSTRLGNDAWVGFTRYRYDQWCLCLRLPIDVAKRWRVADHIMINQLPDISITLRLDDCRLEERAAAFTALDDLLRDYLYNLKSQHKYIVQALEGG